VHGCLSVEYVKWEWVRQVDNFYPSAAACMKLWNIVSQLLLIIAYKKSYVTATMSLKHNIFNRLNDAINVNKPVGDWISAPSPNIVDPQTMTLSDPQMQILGSKLWALGGLNQKSKKTVL